MVQKWARRPLREASEAERKLQGFLIARLDRRADKGFPLGA